MNFMTQFQNELDAKIETRNEILENAKTEAADAAAALEEIKNAVARTLNADSDDNFEEFKRLEFRQRCEEKRLNDAKAVIEDTEKQPLFDLTDYASVVTEIEDHYLGVVAAEKEKIPAAIETLTSIRDAVKAAEADSNKCGRLLDAACRESGHPVPRVVNLREGGTKAVSHAAGIHTAIASHLDKAIAELKEAAK